MTHEEWAVERQNKMDTTLDSIDTALLAWGKTKDEEGITNDMIVLGFTYLKEAGIV